MAAKLALLCGALLAAPLAISAQPTSCQGKPNLQPIWEGTVQLLTARIFIAEHIHASDGESVS